MVDVRYWHKADMLSCTAHVRLVPIADIGENERQDRFLLAKRLSRSLISANRIACCGSRSFCNLFWLRSLISAIRIAGRRSFCNLFWLRSA